VREGFRGEVDLHRRLLARRLIEDTDGTFAWAEPDARVHAFVNDLERPVGPRLYGRRMHETMVFWENLANLADQPVGFGKSIKPPAHLLS
jgi:hypothetical protein